MHSSHISGKDFMTGSLDSSSLFMALSIRSSVTGIAWHDPTLFFSIVSLSWISASMPLFSIPPHSSQKHFQSFSLIIVKPSVAEVFCNITPRLQVNSRGLSNNREWF
uniref:Uncharacterized protein n=1 Tax=Opuntia streptacantha TaxID=393608 RepID=A0A7C8YD92_OPUST